MRNAERGMKMNYFALPTPHSYPSDDAQGEWESGGQRRGAAGCAADVGVRGWQPGGRGQYDRVQTFELYQTEKRAIPASKGALLAFYQQRAATAGATA
jgi:hypothetical protein